MLSTENVPHHQESLYSETSDWHPPTGAIDYLAKFFKRRQRSSLKLIRDSIAEC